MTEQLDDDLKTRLAAVYDPADDSDWLDVRERARRVGAAARGPRRRIRAPRSWARAGRLVAACVAVAAVATVLVELLAPGDESRRVSGLDAIAAIAAAAPSTAPDAGEYAYMTRRYGTEGKPADCTQEWWIAADGSGRVRQQGKLCSPLLPISDGAQGDGLDLRFGPGRATEYYVRLFAPGITRDPKGLPTDPARLEETLERELRRLPDGQVDGPLSRTDGMLQMVDQVLANPLASPALRSALYRVAAALPGVEVKDRVTDPEGRTGSAITLSYAMHERLNVTRELIFDPTTSASLARRTTFTGPGGDRVSEFHAYLDQRTVGSLARP